MRVFVTAWCNCCLPTESAFQWAAQPHLAMLKEVRDSPTYVPRREFALDVLDLDCRCYYRRPGTDLQCTVCPGMTSTPNKTIRTKTQRFLLFNFVCLLYFVLVNTELHLNKPGWIRSSVKRFLWTKRRQLKVMARSLPLIAFANELSQAYILISFIHVRISFIIRTCGCNKAFNHIHEKNTWFWLAKSSAITLLFCAKMCNSVQLQLQKNTIWMVKKHCYNIV